MADLRRKTNKELGRELNVHPRQISKSRKRGWIWKDGKRVKYTAPSIGLIMKIRKTKGIKE